jgi:hypothetical protein
MKLSDPIPAPGPGLQAARTVAANVAFWLTLCAVGAAGSYSDALRGNPDANYMHLLWAWCRDHVPVCLLGTVLHLVHRRWPDCFASAARLAAGYLLVLAVFQPAQLLYIAATSLPAGQPVTLAAAQAGLFKMHRFDWFVEIAWTSGTYIGVVALCLWRQDRRRQQALQRAENDVLRLQLALERQRLQAVRGQLEPHFMFNALNAVSALVRAGDGALALAGIGRLSDLLRHTLAASEREWVTLCDELQFVRDYLGLQRLRHGERLRVTIEGDVGELLAADCPPLLLQPLVENALRHGLERHDGAGDVCLAFARIGDTVEIRIGNAVPAAAPANPGTGHGLRGVRARLHLACGPGASLETHEHAGRFEVRIRMPLHGADATPALAGCGLSSVSAGP